MKAKISEYIKLTRKASRSRYEDDFAFYLKAYGVPFEREYKFHPTRKWRFDFAFPPFMIAAEIEGGIFSGGRHTRGTGYQADCEKYNEAAALGWRVFRFTPEMLKNGTAYGYIIKHIKEANHA